jgi:hypothetical protein
MAFGRRSFLAMENYGIFRLWVEVSDLSRALHNIPVHTTITARTCV